MGAICSDPKRKPENNWRFTTESFDDSEFSDCSISEPLVEVNAEKSPPFVKTIPLSSKQLCVNLAENKKRDCYFDLDSVNDSHSLPEKALSDITLHTCKHNPYRPARLTKANLSIRDSKGIWKGNSHQVPVQFHKEQFNPLMARSVCSDQPLYRMTYQGGHRENIRSICSRCSSREYLANGRCISHKSDSVSDSLEYPRSRKKESEPLKLQKDQVDLCKEGRSIGNKLKSNSPQTCETDRTSPFLSYTSMPVGSQRCADEEKKHNDGYFFYSKTNDARGKGDLQPVDLNFDFRKHIQAATVGFEKYTSDSLELHTRPSEKVVINENEDDGGLIFNTTLIEGTINKGWQEADYVKRQRRSEAFLP